MQTFEPFSPLYFSSFCKAAAAFSFIFTKIQTFQNVELLLYFQVTLLVSNSVISSLLVIFISPSLCVTATFSGQ